MAGEQAVTRPRTLPFGLGADRSVDERPLSGIRVRVPSGITQQSSVGGIGRTAQMGQAIIRGQATDLGQFAAEQQARADQVRIMDADVKIGEKIADIAQRAQALRGEEGPKATELANELDLFFEKEISPSLFGDRQQLQVRRLIQQRRLALRNDLERHAHREYTRFERERAEASLAEGVRQAQVAALSGGEDAIRRVQFELGKSEEIFQHLGKQQGDADEVTRERSQAYRDKVHSRNLNALASMKRFEEAKAYSETFGDEISPKMAAAIQRHAEEKAKAFEHDAAAEQIAEKFTSNAEALKFVREHFAEDDFEPVWSRVKFRKAEEARALRDDVNRSYLRSQLLVSNNPRQHPKSIIPSEDWQMMTADMKAALIKDAGFALRKGGSNRRSKRALADAFALHTDGELLKKNEAEIAEIRGKLSPADAIRFEGLLGRARKAESSAAARDTQGSTKVAARTISSSDEQRIMRDIARQVGVKIPNRDTSAKARATYDNLISEFMPMLESVAGADGKITELEAQQVASAFVARKHASAPAVNRFAMSNQLGLSRIEANYRQVTGQPTARLPQSIAAEAWALAQKMQYAKTNRERDNAKAQYVRLLKWGR